MTRPTDTTASLLPPASTTLELDLEQTMARLDGVPLPMGTIWDADTCPANLLGFLAWSLSVDEWDPAWSEQVMREAIRVAPMLSSRKGTIWAIENALNKFGLGTKVKEWWAMDPPGAPGTFAVVTELQEETFQRVGAALTPQTTDQIRRVIDANKPLSRTYTMTVSFAAFGIKSQLTMVSIGTPMQTVTCTGMLQ